MLVLQEHQVQSSFFGGVCGRFGCGSGVALNGQACAKFTRLFSGRYRSASILMCTVLQWEPDLREQNLMLRCKTTQNKLPTSAWVLGLAGNIGGGCE